MVIFTRIIAYDSTYDSVTYLGGTCGHGPPWNVRKDFLTRYAVKKLHFKPIYFAQKCPQNAGNAVPETQISKHFRTPTIVSSLWHPPHYATVMISI